jgi:transcriptional regulator with XRE-family HTH domain
VITEEQDLVTAARLLELRKRKGWTQARLAREMGVAVTTVTRWEAGQRITLAMSKLIRATLEP